MFHDSDFEFFQDLVQWCNPTVEEAVPFNVNQDTQKTLVRSAQTPMPPQSWDYLDSNSSYTQGMYACSSNLNYPIANYQNVDISGNFNTELIKPHELIKENISQIQVQPLSRPVLPEIIHHSTRPTIKIPAVTVGWQTHDADFTKISVLPNSLPFEHQCSWRNMRNLSVVPQGIERNHDKYEHIINDNWHLQRPQVESEIHTSKTLESLAEHEKKKIEEDKPHSTTSFWDGRPFTMRDIEYAPSCSYKPILPKYVRECTNIKQSPQSRLHGSEDSETHNAALTRINYKKRKHTLPIKDMIRELAVSQELTKVRRGRPPKRRESASSSSCGLDLNLTSISSTHESKYREFRDKNNQSSKRSRLSRKYKELQMEQLSEDLEERNEKLRIRASMLEDAVKKLREIFLTAVSERNQVGSNPETLIRALYGDKYPER